MMTPARSPQARSLRMLIVLLLVGWGQQRGVAQPATWQVAPTNASGAVLGTVTWNDATVSAGSWIGAFDPAGHCAGASQIVLNAGQSYFNLPIYGDDATTTQTDEGITADEAFTLRLWTAGVEVDYVDEAGDVIWLDGWMNANGAPMTGYADAETVYNFASEFLVTIDCPASALCVEADPIALAAQPAGGQFNGPGVMEGHFDPLAAGVGMHTITYVVEGVPAECQIEVTPAPDATFLSPTSFCANDAPTALEAQNPGGIWSGNGVFGTMFDPAVVMPGTVWVSYVVTAGGCEATSETAITVYPAPAPPDLVPLADGGFLVSGAQGMSVTWWIDGEEAPQWADLTQIPAQPEASTLQVTISNTYGCTAASDQIQLVAVTNLMPRPTHRPAIWINTLGQIIPPPSRLNPSLIPIRSN